MAYPTDPIYKLVKNIDGEVKFVKCEQSSLTKHIPFDEANIDYQEYLEWAKTNTAEEAD